MWFRNPEVFYQNTFTKLSKSAYRPWSFSTLTLGIVSLIMFFLLLLLFQNKHCIERLEFFMKSGVISLVEDDISIAWLLINILYIVSRVDLGRIRWNLRNRPIVLLIFWVIFFICSTKFSFTTSNIKMFWNIQFFKGM